MIKIVVITVEEYIKQNGFTLEDVNEQYGENVDTLYYAETEEDTGSYCGVRYRNGTCAVFGARRDEANITFEYMTDTLLGEFNY